jgi:hypothetical protein
VLTDELAARFLRFDNSQQHSQAQVIPEGALVVKTALLEEEHDFGAVVVLST